MSDHIPLEVVTNILERLRVNDLVRCRRVSKLWLAIIDSPQFIRNKLHSSTSTTSNAALFLQPLGNNDANNLLCWREEYGSAPIQYPYVTDKVLLMGSCRGLICFARVHRPHDLVVLNPSTGERHVVSSFLNDEEFHELKACGFGYDEISQGYKVVLITQPQLENCIAKIYDIRHKTFSRSISIGSPTIMCERNTHKLDGVFLCGAIHWCTMHVPMCCYCIQALDLASETICILRLPPNLHCEGNGFFKWSVGVVDSCLCVCVLYGRAGKTDIWLMKEYGIFESWSKIYTIDSVPGSVIPLGSNGARILLMLDRHRLVWCDLVKNLVVEAVGAGDELYDAIYCVDSLVKFFQLPEVDDPGKDDYQRIIEVKRKEHEAMLLLLDQYKPATLPCLSLPHHAFNNISLFDEIPSASDEEDWI